VNLDLSNKNALVCGASRGIGRAAAVELAKLGANVVVVARNAALLSEVSLSLPKTGNQHHSFLKADFNIRTDLHRKISGLTAQMPIHILINNTGGPPGGPILDSDPKAFIKAFEQHLICNHLLVQLVVPGMKKEGFGRIINVISTSVKQPIPGLRHLLRSWDHLVSL